MKKEEILAKVKHQGIDEREQNVFLSSFGIGNIITLILCFLFTAINGIRGKGYDEFITITFATLSVTQFYQYKELKYKKSLLICAIMSGLMAIISFISFIIKG